MPSWAHCSNPQSPVSQVKRPLTERQFVRAQTRAAFQSLGTLKVNDSPASILTPPLNGSCQLALEGERPSSSFKSDFQ